MGVIIQHRDGIIRMEAIPRPTEEIPHRKVEILQSAF